MKAYDTLTIQKINQSKIEETDDFVISEYPLSIYINDQLFITLLCTPKDMEYLIIGYLKNEKIIESLDEIRTIEIIEDDWRANVFLHKEMTLDLSHKVKLLTSGCGVGTTFHKELDQLMIQSISSDMTLSSDEIYHTSKEFNEQSGLFTKTGGVHSCLYHYKDHSIYFEDIGRHNAVDKVCGYILKHHIDTSQSYIFSSGRISSDMLLKCAVSNIPIVISRSAPTTLAVKLAESLGITLVGFVRGRKCNIYSNPDRIEVSI